MGTHAAAFVAGAVVVTAVAATAAPRRGVSQAPAGKLGKLDVFAEALAVIETNYVDDLDEQKLVYGAVEGMIARLDEHSRFLPPKRYRHLREDTEGEYGGIGISVDLETGRSPEVSEVLPGSPAEQAGIAVGDQLLAVDGVPTTDGAWRGTMRGRAGTRVRVRVGREGWAVPRTFTLVRERIRVPAVEATTLSDRVVHVRVRQFQQGTADDVRLALGRVLGAETRGRGVVLDLRGNPGGLFDEAVALADMFVAEGPLVSVIGRRGRDLDEELARRARTMTDVAVAVLVDERSASAAEIVAGALQDHGRAVVVGTRSFGKGTVQSFIDLRDGSGLKLTTARYFTPSGRSIAGRGIEPDRVVTAGAAESARLRRLAVRPQTAKILAEDRQLLRAFETVLGDNVASSSPRARSLLPRLDTLTPQN